MVFLLMTALELGCIYTPVALALFLSYRTLNIADMTTDGCFVLGAAVSVVFCLNGHPFFGIPMAMLAGMCAGFVTAYLQTRMGVPSILAGIITNTGLYTVNLMAMGWKSNVSLLKGETLFTIAANYGIPKTAIVLGVCILCIVAMRWFMSTRLGLSIRATGDNDAMVSASSIDPRYTITVGLMISNMFTGLAGGIAGQYQKTADINGGTGIVVIGLACLIIGETLIRGRRSITRNIFACLVGNVIYRFIYAVILRTHVVPVECLKLMTALIVALAIAAPAMRDSMNTAARRRREV